MSRYLLCVYDNEGCIYVLDASGRQEVNPAATDILHIYVYLCVVMYLWHVGGTFVLQDLVPRRG